MSRAVVLGGGLAGVLAAAALTRHADEVVVLESDHYPASPARGGGFRSPTTTTS